MELGIISSCGPTKDRTGQACLVMACDGGDGGRK